MSLPNARGVWAPALTPITTAGEPDTARFATHARWLLDHGCHGVAVFGTTSEATSFSIAQREAMLEGTIEAGIDPERLMVGTGACAVADAARLTAHAVDRGCPHVLTLPPFYYKGVSDDGLFRYYAGLIEAVGRGRFNLFLYHIPQISQIPISFDLVRRLQEAYPETMKGVKDSSGDAAHGIEMMRAFPDLEIFPGAEHLMLDGLRNGGAGCISAAANVNVPEIRAVFDAHASGEGDADALHARVVEIRKVIQTQPVIPGLKAIVADARKDPGWRHMMPPLVDLPDAAAADLVEGLKGIGFRVQL